MSQYFIGIGGRIDSFSKTFNVRVSTFIVIENPSLVSGNERRLRCSGDLPEHFGGLNMQYYTTCMQRLLAVTNNN